MGELILCNEQIAGMPYFIEGLSLNIYSLEELCYYISKNTFLIEKDFMNEELCTWIEKEADFPKLAIRLREVMHSGGLLSDFVWLILKNVGYCTDAEIEDVMFTIKQMEQKSEFERNKIRADKLLENEKYLCSIYEYKRLLERDDIRNENAIIIGNIWHNLGTAYARLFLFEEAINCYDKAYSYNDKKESLMECLLAYMCMEDEEGFEKKCKDNHISEEEMLKLKDELADISSDDRIREFCEKIETLKVLKKNNKSKYKKEFSKVVFEWKEDYRRICRI